MGLDRDLLGDADRQECHGGVSVKIYVITKGDYSDYHICAVAIDKEQAYALAHFYSTKYDAAEVEEYDTEDVPDLTKGREMFYVVFDPAGNVNDIFDIDISHWDEQEPFELKTDPGFVRMYVQADNKGDAVKIGAERRAKYIAEKLGL